jgi:[ribosomal protein S5]-alanine N-acetyltransferase
VTPSPGPYFLCSPRLGFRTWTDADLPLALALWGDPAVTRLIGGPFSPEQVAERLRLEQASQAAAGLQYWPVFSLACGAHIGCCGLRPYRPAERLYEIGVHLRPAQWGHGYAREAATAVIAYAFTRLPVEGLFAGHHPGNHASRRLLQALGFCYTHDELYPPTGLQHPSYRLTAEAFAARRKDSR